MAFDHSEWGQDFNSDQAESGIVTAAYNWTALGTYGAVRKCFKSDNIENGLSSRMLMSEMPDNSYQKMQKYGRRTPDDEERIQDAVTLLRNSSGIVDVPRLRKTIDMWVEEKRIEAIKDIDHAKDIYRRRSAVIGFRCGIVFHLLTGKKHETKSCLTFARIMAEYCLQQQLAAFGDAFLRQHQDADDSVQRQSRNQSVFDELPETFNLSDLRHLKGDQCGESALRKIISRWCQSHWIEKTGNRHWRKCPAGIVTL